MRGILFLFSAVSAFGAGPLIIGGRGGVPFNTNKAITNSLGSSLAGRPFEIGPIVGLRLPLGFSIEGDALYKCRSWDIDQPGGFTASTHTDSWEFPVMAKFTLERRAVIAPIFGAGVTIRHLNHF